MQTPSQPAKTILTVPDEVLGVIAGFLIHPSYSGAHPNDLLFGKVHHRFMLGLASCEELWFEGNASNFGGKTWDPSNVVHRDAMAARLHLNPTQRLVLHTLDFPSSTHEATEEELHDSAGLLESLRRVSICRINAVLSVNSAPPPPGMFSATPLRARPRFSALSQMTNLQELVFRNLASESALPIVSILGASKLSTLQLHGNFPVESCVDVISQKRGLKSTLQRLKIEAISLPELSLARLRGCTELEVLSLLANQASVFRWSHLSDIAPLSKLRALQICSTTPDVVYGTLRADGFPLAPIPLLSSCLECLDLDFSSSSQKGTDAPLILTTEVFQHIAQLKSLRRLRLRSGSGTSDVSPSSIRCLAGLQLEFLDLPCSQLTSPITATAAVIADLFSTSLTHLALESAARSLSGPKGTWSYAPKISEMLDGPACWELVKLTKLEFLSLANVSADDDAIGELQSLGELADLRVVHSGNCQVTTIGLRTVLINMPSMRHAQLRVHPSVTARDVDAILNSDEAKEKRVDRVRRKAVIAGCLAKPGEREPRRPQVSVFPEMIQ